VIGAATAARDLAERRVVLLFYKSYNSSRTEVYLRGAR
jgi:hypothetical protein